MAEQPRGDEGARSLGGLYSRPDPEPADREIVNTLLETKAINFEALGKALGTFGPKSISMVDDGWIRWCGNDLRIYRWPRPRLGLEELTVLRDILREMPGRR